MAYELNLPRGLRQQRWKVKIYDRERLEPPHVTIKCGARTWRLGLRDGEFLDPGAKWQQIDPQVRALILEHWPELQREWDRMYPDNPVPCTEEGDDDGGQA